MSETTKKALAASLKRLLRQKPLDKITVVDLVEDCEVGRQTFYYHFRDLYDLIEWIYKNEAGRVIGQNISHTNWQEGFSSILSYVLENKDFVLASFNSQCRDYLSRFLFDEMFTLLINLLNEMEDAAVVPAEDRAFIANFYKFGFVGLLLEWIRGGMRESPQALTNKLSTLMEGDFYRALQKFRIDKPFEA